MRVSVLSTLLFLAVLVVSPARSTQARKSRRDVYVDIINSNTTDITNYPYTVAVLGTSSNLLGGGALVAPKWVLTAAYNTDGFQPYMLKVRVGSNKLSSGGKQYKVTKIVTNPNYIANWTYNLSLLRLGSAVNSKFGSPIPVATSAFVGSATVTVTGYGATNKSSLGAGSALQVANIDMFDFEACDEDWYGSELSAGEICGYAAGVGPCYSDFGDPVAECDSSGSCTLVGMFSGSYGCADDHFPGIYMDIGYFYDWISGNMNSLKD